MPAPTVAKLIVTNRGEMKAKYGTQGYRDVVDEVKKLIAADKNRDIASLFVELDDPTVMKKYKAKVVTNFKDEKQNKVAIDGLNKTFVPAYIMILGAPDIVPHQLLTNLIDPGHDEDKKVPSDLPYACEAPFSRQIKDFLGPSRVVGR